MSHFTWAYSLNTIQYINNCIYGSTVMGGNIICIDENGKVKMVWENDFADPDNGGVFMFSAVYSGKLWFMPFLYKYIVIFDPDQQTTEKIPFYEKEDTENLYPHIYNDRFLVFGTKTGRVWQLRDGTVTKICPENKEINDIIKFNNSYEERYVFFEEKEKNGFAVFDCEKAQWMTKPTSKRVTYGFADNNDIYYSIGQKIKKYSLSTHEEIELTELDHSDIHPSVIKIDDNNLLVFPDRGDTYKRLELGSMVCQPFSIDVFSGDHLHFAFNIGTDKILFVNVEIVDWILRKGDRYIIYDTGKKTYKEIPMFNIEHKSQIMFKSKFLKTIGYEIENDINDLSDFVETIKNY